MTCQPSTYAKAGVLDLARPDMLCIEFGFKVLHLRFAERHYLVLTAKQGWSAKGLQAVRICSIDNSTAIHPSQLPQRTHVVVVPDSDWEQAVVKWFQPTTRLWLSHSRAGGCRYFCAYGDAAPLRLRRASAWPDGAGTLWQRTKRSHRRGPQT